MNWILIEMFPVRSMWRHWQWKRLKNDFVCLFLLFIYRQDFGTLHIWSIKFRIQTNNRHMKSNNSHIWSQILVGRWKKKIKGGYFKKKNIPGECFVWKKILPSTNKRSTWPHILIMNFQNVQKLYNSTFTNGIQTIFLLQSKTFLWFLHIIKQIHKLNQTKDCEGSEHQHLFPFTKYEDKTEKKINRFLKINKKIIMASIYLLMKNTH